MNLARIRRDIAAAQQYFDYVEDRATAAGSLMALMQPIEDMIIRSHKYPAAPTQLAAGRPRPPSQIGVSIGRDPGGSVKSGGLGLLFAKQTVQPGHFVGKGLVVVFRCCRSDESARSKHMAVLSNDV